MMLEDPTARLFAMFHTHCSNQIRLATSILDFRALDKERVRIQDRLYADDKPLPDSDEERQLENRYGELEDQCLKLKEEIRTLAETLTGVGFAHLAECDLA